MHDLNIYNSRLKRIDFNNIQPGDVVCTYEQIASKPSTKQVVQMQGLTRDGFHKNLAKMVHFEIVVEKLEKQKVMKVAHANGLSKHIEMNLEDFSKYTPGTALVIFRPKEETLRKEILDISNRTANAGAQWKIKGITDKKSVIGVAIKRFIKSFKAGKLKDKLIRLTLDASTGPFKTKKGEAKAMSCAQYVSNVINSAEIRSNPVMKKIINTNLCNTDQKIKLLTKKLDTKDYLNHSQVTSAALVKRLMNNPNLWETVGYAGIIANESNPQVNDVIFGKNGVNLNLLSDTFSFSSVKLEKVFKQIGLLKNGCLVGHINEIEVKLKTAFIYLLTTDKRLNLSLLTKTIIDPEFKNEYQNLQIKWNEFKLEIDGTVSEKGPENEEDLKEIFLDGYKDHKYFEEFKEMFLNKNDQLYGTAYDSCQKFINLTSSTVPHPVNPIIQKMTWKDYFFSPNATTLLNIEKNIVKIAAKSPTLEQSEIYKLLTVNSLECEKINHEKIYSIAVKALVILSGVLAIYQFVTCAVITAVALAVLAGVRHAHLKNLELQKRQTEEVSQAAHSTTKISVTLKDKHGFRPWIYYSIDDGNSWLIESLTQPNNDAQFEIRLRLEKEQILKYKFFLTTFDNYDKFDPLQNAIWETGDDRVLINLETAVQEPNWER